MNDQLDSPDTVETLEPVEFRPSPTRHPVPVANFKPAAVSQPQQKPQPVPRRTAFDDNDGDEQDDTFIGRHKGKLGIGVVVLVGGLMAYLISHRGETPARKAPERMMMVQLPPAPPPPPPPPPPPKVEPPPKMEEKMIEQAPVEEQPEPDPKPADEPPPLGTGIKGDGGPSWGLGSEGGIGGGNGAGIGGRRGGPFDGFARSVSSRIRNVISANRKTRAARIPGCELRVWVDTAGRVTRAKLVPSTGDAGMDATLQNEVLPGVQLDPPPPGMPMPIVMRLSARRPN
jgi:hypothetical protein